MNTELVEFTRRALEKGIARPEIGKALKLAGWSDAEVAAAVGAFAPVEFPLPVPKPKPYLSAWEVFIYLLMFTALYVSAFNLGSLGFQFIDRAFPDPLLGLSFSAETIRWNIASLVVAFPLFLFMFRLVGNAIAKDPTKRGSRPRKWLTYLTLFVAASWLIGDIITLIYNVLGGEYTLRFLLKVATVALIAGGIFGYFLYDIRKDELE
jgi:hypothetical protein